MTESELRRKLLYRGYDDMVDYLRNSPGNRYIYKQLLVLLPKNDIDVPILDIFNEVYYVCVRVRFDNNPGVDVGRRYIPDVEVRLDNCRPAAQLVFCLAWVLFRLKMGLNFHEECFMDQLTPYINKSIFHDDAKRILDDLKHLGWGVLNEFPTMTSPIEELPLHSLEDEERSIGFKRLLMTLIEEDEFDMQPEVEAWCEVTNNFSHATIESYLTLFLTPMDRVRFIEGVRWACVHGSKKNRKKNEDYLVGLRDRIINELEEQQTQEEKAISCHDFDSDGRILQLRHCYVDKDDKSKVPNRIDDMILEQLRGEINLLKDQNEIQKKQYEEKIEEIESKYKQDIEELKAKLQEKEEAAKTVETELCELSFTISEIVNYGKERIDELSIGKEVSRMLIRLLLDRHIYDEENFQLIDGIEKSIKAKNTHQMLVELPHVGQVNINPQKVENHVKEVGHEKEES